jgi:hypothetical protein
MRGVKNRRVFDECLLRSVPWGSIQVGATIQFTNACVALVSFGFVSFGLVSFRLVWFRFVSFRVCSIDKNERERERDG